ncbi:MAG: HEAT repeat domain-containing protein, partial [Zavarzinella sp.]|nr:HEAT repeat domain-containing protein [Zavarzinella sp.]
QEIERQRRRQAGASADRLRAVARDAGEPEAARAEALLGLVLARDPELPVILLGLFADPNPNPALWRLVVRSQRPADPRVIDHLRRLLDEPDPGNWSEAAMALARLKDPAVLPRLEDWLRAGDRPHRNAAVQCLKAFDAPTARTLLRARWDGGPGDEEDRLVLAAILLDLGDPSGATFLEQTARAAKGDWAVFAATAIYLHDPRRGLGLMLGILDAGDLEARQGLVSQVWNLTDLPHAFTADGVHEARAWVEAQLASAAV